MLTVPDGSAESFDNSVDWIACNLEYAPAQWGRARARATGMGIRAIPWIRLCHPNEGEDFETIKERLALLVLTAQVWGETAIMPNYENEAEPYSPASVNEYLRGYLDWDGETSWSMPGWLANSPDYRSMAGDSVHLQIFPADMRWAIADIPRKMGDCVEHARDKGFTYVGVTYQTYASAQPAWFDVGSYQHSTFPGNQILAAEWPQWYV